MRLRYLLRLSVFLFILLLPANGPLLAGQPTWSAGVAREKITPTLPLWLAGYAGRDHPAEGTLHDLWIKVLALEAANGHRAVVVTSDLLGFPKVMYEGICAELKTRCGLDRSQIMLTSSHTHCGPVLQGALYDCYPLDDQQRALIKQYSTALEKTVVSTVQKALSAPEPATLWAGNGFTDFAVNRRNNREKEVAELRQRGAQLKGPVDHSVPVLAVRTLEGRLRAVVFGYACHNTTLSFYQWCGDYAGFAQISLERGHPDALAMFYQGCGADQNPLPRRSVELCQKYGRVLAAAVDEVLGGPMTPIAPRLSAAFEFVQLDFQSSPTVEDLQAAAATTGLRQRWARRILEKIQKGEPLATSYSYPVQVWRLGSDQLWISLGGEVVVDYALLFKAKYGPGTWVAGYANDVMAYIPSRRVWQEGGYEAGAFHVYGLPTESWAPDIEQRVTACVDRLVAKTR